MGPVRCENENTYTFVFYYHLLHTLTLLVHWSCLPSLLILSVVSRAREGSSRHIENRNYVR
jgi:hypothetical protein